MSGVGYSVKFNQKINEYSKTINVDSDKSLSIRSVLFGAISEGVSEVTNLLESEDVFSSINFVKTFGIKTKKISKGKHLIFGKGLGGFHAQENTKLNFGNSGTLCRLGCGILSTNPNLKVILSGDKSLKRRNLKSLFDVLSKFGAQFYPKNKNFLPIKLVSSSIPIGIEFVEKKGSAQMLSAVALAGLNTLAGKTKIIQKKEARDHTQIFLKNIGAELNIKKHKKNKIVEILGKKKLNSFKITIPGDPSSAAFFTALTILKKNSSLKIKNIGLNPTRIGFYQLLKKHGAKIKIEKLKKKNNELVGNILVKSSKIKPIKAGPAFYSKTVDEFPILFVIAALNDGSSKFEGIKDLANKESNRILEMKKLLKKININCKSDKNKMVIKGKRKLNKIEKTILVDPKLDHRICQSAAILALATGISMKIKNFDTVNTSAPSFLKKIMQLGGKFEIQKN